MSSYLAEFLVIATIHFLAVASPGPDLAITLRQSITFGRRAGLWTSLGIGVGIFVHVAYCILGLGLIVSQSVLVFSIIKYVGAFYLIYIGINALRAKPNSNLPQATLAFPALTISAGKAFTVGVVTNALNPKVTLFFLAVFSVTVSPSTPALIKAGYGLWMSFATILWFGTLSLLFSKEIVREAFLKFGHWFEKTMGILLVALGLRLAFART